jgi:hypothetical protein
MKTGYLYIKLLIIISLTAVVLFFISGAVFQLYNRSNFLLNHYRLHNELSAVLQMLQLELKSSPGIIDTVSYPTNSQQLSFWNTDHEARVLTVKNQRLVLQGSGTTYLTSTEWPVTNFTVIKLANNIYRISFSIHWQNHDYSFQRSFKLLNVS